VQTFGVPSSPLIGCKSVCTGAHAEAGAYSETERNFSEQEEGKMTNPCCHSNRDHWKLIWERPRGQRPLLPSHLPRPRTPLHLLSSRASGSQPQARPHLPCCGRGLRFPQGMFPLPWLPTPFPTPTLGMSPASLGAAACQSCQQECLMRWAQQVWEAQLLPLVELR
jgi:hypothetical protein